MPRKKSNLNNASTREARRKRIKRAHQLAEQIESRNLAQRISTAEGHAQESQEQFKCHRKKSNLNNASSKGSRRKRVERAQQLPEQIETRNAAQRIRTAESRARESQEQRDERLQQNITRTRVARERNIATVRALDRQRQRISRSLTRASFVRLAFEYAPDINYSAHSKIAIGGMDKVCQYCHALKFRNEAAGMCCASGKSGAVTSTRSAGAFYYPFLLAIQMIPNYFLRKIRKFNSCFQMTSFGATKNLRSCIRWT
ncbi:helitron_like_N domain-containing protein [Trichonephila clavipes]|nr:helitron_like_N domain-containing protein [Trichonephila clavipes]